MYGTYEMWSQMYGTEDYGVRCMEHRSVVSNVWNIGAVK